PATLLLLLACQGKREAEAPPLPPPSAPTLKDFAGSWESVSRLEGVPDSVVSHFSGPAAETGWLLMLPDRNPIPMRVWVQDDSMIAVTEKYPSLLRPGVMVQVRTSGMLKDSLIQGILLATYDSSAGQQVVRGTFSARRVAADTARP
ncbi:MAG: hypothetical protein ACREMH_07515, partial [Gemmatimonadales bacterium]